MKPDRNHFVTIFGILLCALSVMPGLGFSAEEASETPNLEYQPVTEVLITEGIAVPMPAFHDDDVSPLKPSDVLSALPLIPGDASPAPGKKLGFAGSTSLVWQKVSSQNGLFALGKDPEYSSVYYLAFYLTSDRWQKAHLKIQANDEVEVSLDGESVSFTKDDDEGNASRKGELTLPLGKHLVTIKVTCNPEQEKPGQIILDWAPGEFSAKDSLRPGITPERAVDIQKVLNAPRVSSATISPNGEMVALTLGEYPDGKNKETWLEVRRTKDGGVVQSWRGISAPSSPTWHPGLDMALCWKSTVDDKSTVWMFDFKEGTMTSVLKDVKDMGGWQWTPDGKSVIYSVAKNVETDKRRIKRVLHPADRQPWWRNRSHLMQIFVPGGFTRQLTSGPISAEGWEVSPDGETLVFFMSEPDITKRPFTKSSLWSLQLETLITTKLLEDPWVSGAVFSPDSQTLCLQGSPSAFAGLGRNLPAGVQANDYGGQLYLLKVAGGTPQPISIDLRPDVSSVFWSKADGHIYARCTDTQYNNIYRYNGEDEGWEKIETGLDSVRGFQLAANKKTALAWGSSVSTPNQVFTVDTRKNRAKLLIDPGQNQYQDIQFGKVSNWTATLPGGEQMDGFVFYPPNFDPEKTYPLIVYYYGGTSPITRDFGGRYPKNIWAGQGYMVYVPNPSGATGYGQEYAARHVNDWGLITADEVINGTRAFLASHPFVDADRVGCMGASYGGFLTEYILTRTDIFAAGVSHAGISSISSYWGEGMWGFGYGARALAHSFPWNNPDLFVDQSALFNADKIHTPLLLVHGDSDINVPIGESDQLFTALKILGRDVEYVQIVGQDHHILDHEQRIIWNDTILAYFAKYLKGRSQWWDEMYPEPKDYR